MRPDTLLAPFATAVRLSPPPAPVPPAIIQLKLDETTAGYLLQLCGAVGGLDEGRKATSRVYHALNHAGVRSLGCVEGAVRFRVMQ